MSLASNYVGRLSFDVDKVAQLPEKCDPYILLKVAGNEVKTKRQNDCRNGATFNQEISLSLDGSSDWVEIVVMDWDRWSKDDLIATSGRVPIADVLNNWGTGDYVWVNLDTYGKKKKDPTKLRVKVTFEPKK